MRPEPLVVVALLALGCTDSDDDPKPRPADASASASVLLFSRTTGYRHDSIEDGIAALSRVANERQWRLESTEDPAMFNGPKLVSFDVVVFLNTTGDVLDATQEDAFERFIQSGKGFVGIHAASDTEYDWPFYGALVGAYFKAHPAVQAATLHVEGSHPAVDALPTPWTRTDEWYAFQKNPRAEVQVLLTLDEESYSPGEGAMGEDHPIAWLHQYDGGRAFYTALGHTSESYADPLFLDHLTQAIEWAAGK
jgi:type 1 glutamine amidotransferase